MRALIGSTGYVGTTLLSQGAWDIAVNRSNADDIRGRQVDTLLIAGAPAQKWIANAHPQADLDNLNQLKRLIETVRAEHVVLISTVDVYPPPPSDDETAVIDPASCQPYGRHRLDLEIHVRSHFDSVSVIRLPALFGSGLKKNVLRDLLDGKLLDKINPLSRFQWYDMQQLDAHVELVRETKPGIINFATEPLQTADILARFFPSAIVGDPVPQTAVSYAMKTIHGALFGRPGSPWITSSQETLDRITDFVRQEQGHLA